MRMALSVDEVLSTTRTVRKRLDLSRSVSRAEIEACLDLALQAPNGSNENAWRWVVIDDRDLIRKLANIYRRAALDYMATSAKAGRKWGPKGERVAEFIASGRYLMEILDQVPAMLIPLIEGRPEGKACLEQAIMWESIGPAIWSFFLALRKYGMGSAWTTIGLHYEEQIADLLGIDATAYTQAGLFPIAHTIGTDFKRAWPKPLSDVVLTYNGM